MSLLECARLARHFGGVKAVDGVDLSVEDGDFYGLIGPNGSGKTTLVDLVSRFQRADAGTVTFAGREVTRWPPHRLARHGVARTFQRVRLFRGLSVRENVLAGMQPRPGPGTIAGFLATPAARSERAARVAEAGELLARVGLPGAGDRTAGELAYGQQRRLELARALALHPRLLILDEPAAGMNHSEMADLGALFAELHAGGLTIVLVEHHLRLILDVCTKVAVLNYGRKIADGTPTEVLRDEAVAEAYLGPGGEGGG